MWSSIYNVGNYKVKSESKNTEITLFFNFFLRKMLLGINLGFACGSLNLETRLFAICETLRVNNKVYICNEIFF